MRRYENIIIISPDCSKEEEDELLKRIQGNLEKVGAETIKVDDWGVRRLAYPIKKKDRGHYFFFLLNMEEGSIATIDRFYRTMDLVLRHMFTVVDEKDKGLEKPPEQVVFDEVEAEG